MMNLSDKGLLNNPPEAMLSAVGLAMFETGGAGPLVDDGVGTYHRIADTYVQLPAFSLLDIVSF
jgi:hypothetical protein